jgi:methylmalonyl-CoA epimerase
MVAQEKVNVAMLAVGPSRIELLEPASPDSTIAKFIDKRGPGLHHVAMRVDDLSAVMKRLESGWRKAPGNAAAGRGRAPLYLRPSGQFGWRTMGDYSGSGAVTRS